MLWAMSPFPIREIYCVSHFGNAYECMTPREMAEHLAELKHWGFNRYADWLTATDVRNPYRQSFLPDLGQTLLERKKAVFGAAQSLGLALNCFITPNHVYLDQLRPELAATIDEHISGQLLCPSVPAARRIILANAENWFRDLAESGIRLSTFTASPYDYGGCACDRCSPWVVTFARLVREIHPIAESYHPGIEPWFCTWWWTPNEYALLNEWCASEAPGWLKGLALHIDYDQTAMPKVAVPAGCRKLAFVHVGYSDVRGNNDIYGKYGPVVAPNRIPGTLAAIADQGAEGFQAYSEGAFDDCNKALLGGLGSGGHASAAGVLESYAARYFSGRGGEASRWAGWLSRWGNRAEVDLASSAAEFESLAAAAAPSWRLEQWQSKLKLESLDRAIGTPAAPTDWTAERLELVDRFWREHEHLTRDVYRLGPTRGIFARKFAAPAWYASWSGARERKEPI
jgi:hypothetical protein